MEKVLNIDTLHLYKEAQKRLEEENIPYDASKLLKDPGLCMEIITLMDYDEDKRP